MAAVRNSEWVCCKARGAWAAAVARSKASVRPAGRIIDAGLTRGASVLMLVLWFCACREGSVHASLDNGESVVLLQAFLALESESCSPVCTLSAVIPLCATKASCLYVSLP